MKALTMTLAASLLLSLAACGGGEGDVNASNVGDPNATLKINDPAPTSTTAKPTTCTTTVPAPAGC